MTLSVGRGMEGGAYSKILVRQLLISYELE